MSNCFAPLNKPIITSLLDNDTYKFTMGQFVTHYYPDVEVEFALTNRTKGIKLEEQIKFEDLRLQLQEVKKLRFQTKEIDYLASLKASDGSPRFSKKYLDSLIDVKLPKFSLNKTGDSFELRFKGSWKDVIYWEVPALAIINELYSWVALWENVGSYADCYCMATSHLDQKIRILAKNPGVKFMEFGTRRRFSREWQGELIRDISRSSARENMVGTSNVLNAMKLGLKPMGTMAHELFMVVAGLHNDTNKRLRFSHNKVIHRWLKMYGEDLSVILSDTFGSKFFFEDLSPEQYEFCKGFRQDSGDPFAFANKVLALYQERGIDSRAKTIVFSDGLDLEKILALYNEFSPKINCLFGWGTNLTFDWPGIKPLSIVIKAVEADGKPLVKLSDNVAKAIGAPEEIERYKKVFGYDSQYFKECLV